MNSYRSKILVTDPTDGTSHTETKTFKARNFTAALLKVWNLKSDLQLNREIDVLSIETLECGR